MRLSDLKLEPGDKVLELKNVIVMRANGTQERLTLSEDVTPVPVPTPQASEPDEEMFICETCGFPAKSKIGLSSHMRTHQD